MKITKLLGLAAVSLLALTGCAKEVTYEDALNQVNSYTQEGRKAKIHEVVKVNKLEGIFNNAPFTTYFKNVDKNYENNCCPISAAELGSFKSLEVFKFYLDGTKLEIKCDLSGDSLKKYLEASYGMEIPDEAKVDGKAYAYVKTNEKGIKLLEESNFDISINYSASEFTLNGAMSVSTKITYSLTNDVCGGCN